MATNFEELKAGSFYHIYNRGINSCNLFECDKGYQKFLALFEHPNIRKVIDIDKNLKQFIIYFNNNSAHHGFTLKLIEVITEMIYLVKMKFYICV